MKKFETRAALAAAYHKSRHPGRRMLTHAVGITEQGGEWVLCGRVALGSLADPCATDRTAAPTCEVCLRRLRKEQRS